MTSTTSPEATTTSQWKANAICVDLPHPSQFTDEHRRFVREVLCPPDKRREMLRALHALCAAKPQPD